MISFFDNAFANQPRHRQICARTKITMTIRHMKYIKTKSETKEKKTNVNDENGNASLALFVESAFRNYNASFNAS